MVITDGKSQDPVDEFAKRLRNTGVEIFVLGESWKSSPCNYSVDMAWTHINLSFLFVGIKGADEDELKEMASTPHSNHVYNVANFDLIKDVQRQLITEVCSGVEDQLSSLMTGEERKYKPTKENH